MHWVLPVGVVWIGFECGFWYTLLPGLRYGNLASLGNILLACSDSFDIHPALHNWCCTVYGLRRRAHDNVYHVVS